MQIKHPAAALKYSTRDAFYCNTATRSAICLSMLLELNATVHQKCICKTQTPVSPDFSTLFSYWSLKFLVWNNVTRRGSYSMLLDEELRATNLQHLQLLSKVTNFFCEALERVHRGKSLVFHFAFILFLSIFL